MGLGRGLGALIKDDTPAEPAAKEQPSGGPTLVPLDQIAKSPWQPRTQFEAEPLEELVESVRERGILQPLLVRKAKKGYELIAGERRLRAATEAELDDVPVIVMDISDREALEVALVENIQREDLNLIEEAEGYKALADKFDLTQEQVAERVGKGRATVANAVRLLQLPDEVKQLVSEGSLSAGHAKVLLGLEAVTEQILLARRVVTEGISVRELEKRIAAADRVPKKPRAAKAEVPDSHLQYLSDRLHQLLGTSVRVSSCKKLANGKKAKGTIEIDYFSSDDLDRLLDILGISGEL